jgi:hypothetical protein
LSSPQFDFRSPFCFLSTCMQVKFSSLHAGRVSLNSIPAPPSIFSPRMGQVPPYSIPTHFFNFFLTHESPIGMVILNMKL